MPEPVRCRRCGSSLPADASPEACPACLMRLGLASELGPGSRLGPYEVVAPIGAGGMGVVYRGRDERLKREVAIKVLPASFSTDPDRLRRFEKEAQAASALNHPNIMAVYDIGEQDGAPYIVSELLEGQTLRERLAAGALSPRRAVEYAAQIAKGLTAAHAKGIVHRDLKPENVFVTRGEDVKILDFGVAKLTQSDDAGDLRTTLANASDATEPGVVLGTLAYMSPEQVKGEAVDARSDLFSFGTVLYEMLSGRRAFQRASAAETMAAILQEDPPEISGSGRAIPPALDNIVRHCLEKDPQNRFQSARDVAFSLAEHTSASVASARAPEASAPRARWPWIAAAALAVLALAGGLLLLRRPAAREAEVKRVAVLPFENLGAAEDDYFADGIADEVRGKLTNLHGIEVIARASSTPYKKTTKTPKEIARELDVKYLLTATVRWQKGSGASRVHVTPELVEVRESGAPASKWEQPFDASLTDVFQVQADIATRVAQALDVALAAGEAQRLKATPTRSLDAYDAYLKGLEVWDGSGTGPPAARKALGLFEQAVALDPGFARAWGEVAFSCANLYNFAPTPQLAERALEATRRTVALAPDDAESYMVLGFYKWIVLHDPRGALLDLVRARRISPASAELLRLTAGGEQALGRWDAALEHLVQAERLDPRSVANQRRLGELLSFLKRYPEARKALDRGLDLAPANLSLINAKVNTYLGQGDLAGAKAVLVAAPKEVDMKALLAELNYSWILDKEQGESFRRLTPEVFADSKEDWGLALAEACALNGDTARARGYAEEARKASAEKLRAIPDDPVVLSNLGLALAYLGRKEEAIRAGIRAVALRPIAEDALDGPFFHDRLARIYILLGEPEKALDELEPLLKMPYYLSPGWLRIDPNFAPLRGNPRFQKLVAQKG